MYISLTYSKHMRILYRWWWQMASNVGSKSIGTRSSVVCRWGGLSSVMWDSSWSPQFELVNPPFFNGKEGCDDETELWINWREHSCSVRRHYEVNFYHLWCFALLYYSSLSIFCCCSVLISVGQRGHLINRSGLREMSILDTLKNWYILAGYWLYSTTFLENQSMHNRHHKGIIPLTYLNV